MEDSDDEKPRKKPHIPQPRPVEELFAEDEKAQKHYSDLVYFDDDVDYVCFDGEVQPIETFEEAELYPQLLKNVKEFSKYVRPRKIQSASWPFIFDDFDVKVQGETGSGKTLTYLLPIIDKCLRDKTSETYIPKAAAPYALIICPTRELVLQVFEQAKKFAFRMNVQIAKAYGEFDIQANQIEIVSGCDILIATPGRLRHFIFERHICVKGIKVLVLDEADRLLALDSQWHKSFMKDLLDIVEFPDFPDTGSRQTMLFSATFSPEILRNAEPFIQEQAAFITNNRDNPNKKIIQEFIFAADFQQKLYKLRNLLATEIQSVGDQKKLRQTLIFTNTRKRSFEVADYLQNHGIFAVAINAEKTQEEREKAFNDFRERKISLLVASDLCCRGLDVKDLDHVINFDMPPEMGTYLYRIGRTGRITQGFSTSFILKSDSIVFEIAERMQGENAIIPQVVKDFVQRIRLPSGVSFSNMSATQLMAYRSYEDLSAAASVFEDDNIDEFAFVNISDDEF